MVVTEQSVREALARGERQIIVAPDGIVTPLALEFAGDRGIAIVRRDPASAGVPPPAVPATDVPAGVIVAIGSDHGGFALKKALVEVLSSLGVQTLDVGTTTEEPCDYPDFAYAVAHAVIQGRARFGLMIDGAGIGSCMVVNKVPGIRGACCAHEFTARNAREHNDANVLTLGSRVVGLEVAKGIVRTFLEVQFAGGRHQSRVDKIMDVERRFLRR